MRRLALLSLPVLLAGCASTPPGVPESREERSIVSVSTDVAGSTNLQLTRDAAITTGAIAATPDQVWAALPRVFGELELPVTGVDTNRKVLTASGQRIRRIGGRSVSSYFECPGPYGNAAGSSDVFVTVTTQVLAGEGGAGSTVRTEVDASARASTSSRQVRCTTKGALEKRLMESLEAQVAAG